MRLLARLGASVLLCSLLAGCAALRPPAAKAEAPYTVEWIRQLGTSRDDYGWGISADGLGNVYIGGRTEGSLGGLNAGGMDAFVSKFDAAGNLLWTQQLGTSSTDYCKDVSADGLGNVFVSGYTAGSLGGANAGGKGAFVSKFDAAGNLLWTQQLGTPRTDFAYGVSVDGLGHVYISGYTYGSLGGPNAGDMDAFVSKYDAAGNLLWTQQLGTSDCDTSRGVSVDGLGNVYISGTTGGSLGGPNAGASDAFVSKYDAAGNLLWTQQLGTPRTDSAYGVSADGLGNVFVSGETYGSLGGPNAGDMDAFVSKYDAAGNLLWTQQLG
ncbi:MAG: SBBP repeat-containing protein, partial [Phycisphaerae bacterium]